MVNTALIPRRLFGISPDETTFARRGFPPAESTVQRHLETAGGAFVTGYNAALAKPRAEELVSELEGIDAMYRGFAYEGAAMGLALLDMVTPWNRRRFHRFLETPFGDSHWYMMHVGAGWAVARLPWARRNFERAMRRYHPLYGWLMLDGYGFHEGFFFTEQYVRQRIQPRRLSPHAARVFDQGLGRSMWFSQGAKPARIADVISRFDPTRQQDLWSGVGLAASYAGGVPRECLELLRTLAGAYEPNLAQGAAFAAKARQRAGNPVPHAETACHVFCRMSAQQAAAITDECLRDLPTDNIEPPYQVWRTRISRVFSLAERPPDRTMALDSVSP